MFKFVEPSNPIWCLSKDEGIYLKNDVANNLKSQDIIAIQFLYQNFKNKFRGSILNEENGFNFQVQVSTFLQVLFSLWSRSKKNFLILIISPEYLLQKWSEKLKHFGGLKVHTVTPKTCPEDFDQEDGLALLLSFDHIKVAEALSDYNFASVVVDDCDTIANKLIFKKLSGNFNIGLTRRNFYDKPDQKLQWTMLNWACPGSLGRLIDFYEVDNNNFSNLRDNYHHWWLTLTWNYCETFKRDFEEADYESAAFVVSKRKSNQGRNKTNKIICTNYDENKDNYELKFSDECEQGTNKSASEIYKNKQNNDFSSSSDNTLEYEFDLNTYNQEKSLLPESSTESKHKDDNEDILFNIIEGGNSSEFLDHQTEVDLKKEELYSQIFDIAESHSQNSDSSEDYLQFLIN